MLRHGVAVCLRDERPRPVSADPAQAEFAGGEPAPVRAKAASHYALCVLGRAEEGGMSRTSGLSVFHMIELYQRVRKFARTKKVFKLNGRIARGPSV
jgi:hypothetical protein